MRTRLKRWWAKWRRWCVVSLPTGSAYLCVVEDRIFCGPCADHHGIPLGILLDAYNDSILTAHRAVQHWRSQENGPGE